ncbi:uncharacterized protein B0H18DRAFT_986153, partial [Fomitopsis serialis]|uniref:uncharacterized protein n=1 Tax=Fomitopsis serialis TaxID=139415 RepID=UPI002008CD6E
MCFAIQLRLIYSTALATNTHAHALECSILAKSRIESQRTTIKASSAREGRKHTKARTMDDHIVINPLESGGRWVRSHVRGTVRAVAYGRRYHCATEVQMRAPAGSERYLCGLADWRRHAAQRGPRRNGSPVRTGKHHWRVIREFLRRVRRGSGACGRTDSVILFLCAFALYFSDKTRRSVFLGVSCRAARQICGALKSLAPS